VLGIVAVLGILPPGLHTEPGWPLPFRFDLAALPGPSRMVLTGLAAASLALALAASGAAAAARYRVAGALSGALVFCLGGGWLLLQPGVEPAYPTSFYAPVEAYAAASVVRGAAIYHQNCVLCHGADGRGDGPAAATLPVRPADLTAAHVLVHPFGDLFWWVSHGKGNGAMPGFAPVIPAGGRWDVINFVRARAAGMVARTIGPEVSPSTAPPVPDFAFEWDGRQQTLNGLLQKGPVLLTVFAATLPPARLAALSELERRLAASGLQVVAIALDPALGGTKPHPPLAAATTDVRFALAPFRAPDDGGETDLLLDRAGQVRARWTAGGEAGVADQRMLTQALLRVAQLPASGEVHAGHAH
jgi:mono/diheme cytochrome c family protein